MKRFALLILALALAAMSLTACAANEPPTITSLTAHPSSLLPGGTTLITCVASEPDGDSLTYLWTVDGWVTSDNTRTLPWVAPDNEGVYIIGVTLSDGKGGTAYAECDVSVAATAAVPVSTPTPTPAPTATPTPAPTPTPTPMPTPTPTPTPMPTPTPTPTPAPQAREVVDDLGRTVVIGRTPQRIVSLAPSNTEILFALGLADKVVGVSNFCDYPQELLDKIGAGDIMRVGSQWPGFSLETIVSLTPDVAFAIGETVPGYVEDLEGLGIPVVILQPHNIAGIFADIALVGQITGEEQTAQDLVDTMRDHLVSICQTTATAASRPSVFYELDATNPTLPWTAGSGTFIDTLVTLAAGVNIASASGIQGWATFSLEELLACDPDMIILGDYPWVSPEDVLEREGWEGLSAVQNEAIYSINPDLVSRPGPRIFDGLEDLATIIHPELFE